MPEALWFRSETWHRVVAVTIAAEVAHREATSLRVPAAGEPAVAGSPAAGGRSAHGELAVQAAR